MKKVFLVLAMLAVSVFFAQPAVAEDATTTETVATEAAADAPDAPAQVEAPPPPPAESDPPGDTEVPDTSTPADNNTPPADDNDDNVDDAPADDAEKQVNAAVAPKTAMVVAHGAVTVAAAAAAAPKAWVCKYVGTPGVDEQLKGGKNPIEVSTNAAEGTYFGDAHARSYVVQIGGTDPGVGACPAGDQDTEVTTETPIVSPPTCAEDGALSLPNTPGVLYTVDPDYTGPGAYVVDAEALPNYVLSGASVTHWAITVLDQLSDPLACPVIVNDPPKKVWVCKYVGTPGVDEVFKGGKNPIEVSVNALPGSPVNPQVGQDFSDAQERSHVVALSPADPEPTADDCLPAIVPAEVTAEAPIADPATCEKDGSLDLPQTVGVVYVVEPDFVGPGDYVVTATILNDTFELIGQTVFPVSVGGKLPAADCIVPADGEFLPDTGGSPLELLLIALSMVAAGFMVLMRRSPVTSVGSSAYSLILPAKDEMVSAWKAHDSAQPHRIMTTRESIVSKLRRQRN